MEERTWLLLEQSYNGLKAIVYFAMSWLATVGFISMFFGINIRVSLIPVASFAFIVNVIFWGLMEYSIYLEERK